jgi:UDP-N-acetylglucosamine acyltransferase
VSIHPTAVISPLASIGQGVEIHPFCVIEAGAVVGDGCILESRSVIKSGTTLGRENHLYEGVVLGGLPQHTRVPEKVGSLVIGDHNTFRENVTVHRALEAGHSTRIGCGNLLMINVHIAHDCEIGNQTIFANNAMLAGHVLVDDRAYISGAVGVHQFCRIGRYAMVGGQAHIVKDVPPFVTVDGKSSYVVGLNQVGLRRNGFSRDEITQLKAAYRLIYRSGLRWQEVLVRLAEEFASGSAGHFLEFFEGGKRGFTPERRLPPASTLKLPEESPTLEIDLKAKAG